MKNAAGNHLGPATPSTTDRAPLLGKKWSASFMFNLTNLQKAILGLYSNSMQASIPTYRSLTNCNSIQSTTTLTSQGLQKTFILHQFQSDQIFSPDIEVLIFLNRTSVMEKSFLLCFNFWFKGAFVFATKPLRNSASLKFWSNQVLSSFKLLIHQMQTQR